MNPMSPKVSAGIGAAGASTPLSIIIIWLLGLMSIAVPPEVAASIASLVALVASGLAGYYVPHAVPVVAVVPVAPPVGPIP